MNSTTELNMNSTEEDQYECERCGEMKPELCDVNGNAWCEECVDEYNEEEKEECECQCYGRRT